MAGYLYRYELQDVASRLSAGLVPGSPLSVTDSDGNVTVTVEKAANGHFEARAAINNQPVRLMIDTGASITVLTAADAADVGIDVEALRFTVPVSTANGTTLAARARTEVIAIGAIERRRVPVLVAQPGSLAQSLLGMNVMGTLSGYDVRGDRMILRD
jgi:aspartyl protease family protein